MERRIVPKRSRCGFALAVIIFAIIKISSIEACTQNQYKKILPSGTPCIDCPRCPAGYGLHIQCGTNIPANATIKCQQCTMGVTYSVENEYEQCQQCGVCSDDQVMTQCTTESNTVCHHKCKSKEKYYEQSSDDCQKCTWCCGDDNDIEQDECLKKGMPRQQSCTVHRKKKCTPANLPTTANIATTAKHTVQTQTVMNRTTKQPILFTSKDIRSTFSVSTAATPVDSKSKKELENNGRLDTVWIVLITVGVLAFIALCIFSLRCYCKKRKQRQCYNCHEGMQLVCVHCNPSPQVSRVMDAENRSNHTATVEETQSQHEPLIVKLPPASPSHQETTTNSQSASTSQATPVNTEDNGQIIGAEIELFKWFEEHYDVEEKICIMLDTHKSFAEVARYFGIEKYKISKLVDTPGDHPTKTVLEFVQMSHNPSLKMSEFLVCTDSHQVSRKDVSQILKEALAQE